MSSIAMIDALAECLRFLVRRDEMNAAVHCSEVRWSPLTHRVAVALDQYSVRDVLSPVDVANLDAVLGRPGE